MQSLGLSFKKESIERWDGLKARLGGMVTLAFQVQSPVGI
jgi:hypothetical protein